MTERHARIAITLPPDDLTAADLLARKLDRSRSWVVAEAIRRYVVEMEVADHSPGLDTSRGAQLRRDLALTAEERIRAGEEISIRPSLSNSPLEAPRTFATYDEFETWRRGRSNT